MRLRKEAGTLGVAGGNRSNDGNVLLVRLAHSFRCAKRAPTREVQLLDERIVSRFRTRVRCQGHNSVVERQIERVIASRVPTLDSAVHFGNRRSKRFDPIRRYETRQPSAGKSKKQGADVVNLRNLVDPDLPHEHAVIGNRADEPRLFERPERFADRPTADSQPRRQCQFVQTCTALKLARQNDPLDFTMRDRTQRLCREAEAS